MKSPCQEKQKGDGGGGKERLVGTINKRQVASPFFWLGPRFGLTLSRLRAHALPVSRFRLQQESEQKSHTATKLECELDREEVKNE